MKKVFTKLTVMVLSVLMLLSGQCVTAHAEAKYNAKSIILLEPISGTVMLASNERAHYPIASMVKIMTLLLTFEEIESGNLRIDEKITASENAGSMGGSQAFLDANSEYECDQLIKSIVVASANDSCVAMAERISGSVENFVDKMNARASELGMTDTVFVNCTGLPAVGQYSCAADVAKMFAQLIKHKAYYDYSKVWMFDFLHPSGRVTQLTNTNKLIRAYNGCDGGKTGYTAEAKSCLAATAQRDGTRLVAVAIGSPSSKERNKQICELFNYGFANFVSKKIVSQGEIVHDDIQVSGSRTKFMSVVAESDYTYTSAKGNVGNVTTETIIDKDCAPIKQGEVVGKLNILLNGECIQSVNLLSMSDINSMSYTEIISEMIENW